MDTIESYENNRHWFFLFTILQGLGLACVVITVIWVDTYFDGFAWDGSSKMFNWHPVLMVVAFVYLYGNGKSVMPVQWNL